MTEAERLLKQRESRKKWRDAHPEYHKQWWARKLEADPDYHKRRWDGGKAKWNTAQRRERNKNRARENRLSNPEKYRLANKRSRRNTFYRGKQYGLTRAMFDELLSSQAYSCAICKVPFKVESDSNIDHCHSTGVVRGLLCQQCNAGLGMFGDSFSTCIRAASYLRKFLPSVSSAS